MHGFGSGVRSGGFSLLFATNQTPEDIVRHRRSISHGAAGQGPRFRSAQGNALGFLPPSSSHTLAPFQLHFYCRIKQPLSWLRKQQPFGRFLNRRVMRYANQFNRIGQRVEVDEVLGEPPIVRLQKVFQHQAREQLVLGDLLRTVQMTIRKQRLTGNLPSG